MTTIAELRRARNLSQIEVAARAGLSASALSRMENGKPVAKSTLTLVCQVLGVTPDQVSGVKVYSAVQTAARRKQA